MPAIDIYLMIPPTHTQKIGRGGRQVVVVVVAGEKYGAGRQVYGSGGRHGAARPGARAVGKAGRQVRRVVPGSAG